jgi:SpoVK/Ycf46/Vps4 family AAA+-type ATPase
MKGSAESETFEGTPIALIEATYLGAPAMAKLIVSHLQDPNYAGSPEFRTAFLVGDPGTRKKTLAKAIAYKAQRELVFFSATDFLDDQRNGLSRKLVEKLKVIVAEKKAVVVVVDGINRLLENYENKCHDSAVLWDFLDRQYGNHNFFLLGTMNSTDKISQSSKGRMLAQCILTNELRPKMVP